MSDKELSRINVIQSVAEKRMRRRDAAHQLALTERQTQRLMNRFRDSDAAGLANLRRGHPGNQRLPESLRLRVLSILHDHYSDFGPTLAAEKLRERHNITVSVETLRKWMTADGLWVPYSRRRPRVHQPRYLCKCLGELFQIDGSPHDWLKVERRNAACSSLLVCQRFMKGQVMTRSVIILCALAVISYSISRSPIISEIAKHYDVSSSAAETASIYGLANATGN